MEAPPPSEPPEPDKMRRLASGLAHELRNPLNSAKLQLDALLRTEAHRLSSQTQERVAAALQELARVSDLIDDYLSLVTPRGLQTRPTVLHQTVAEAVAVVCRELSHAPSIAVEVEARLPLVEADERRVTQILVHLLRNSVEATANARPRRIAISASAESTMVKVTVRDNGHGFSEEVRARAFEPFVTTKTNGTGLGLTLVREAVAAHGGAVTLNVGHESTVVGFTLPQWLPPDSGA
ncbi:MAG: HAMP domain-containing sensor histidine kinase [Myxococcota bacterium]